MDPIGVIWMPFCLNNCVSCQTNRENIPDRWMMNGNSVFGSEWRAIVGVVFFQYFFSRIKCGNEKGHVTLLQHCGLFGSRHLWSWSVPPCFDMAGKRHRGAGATSMIHVFSAVSGEALADVDANGFQCVRDLKRNLAVWTGHSRFRQRLFSEGKEIYDNDPIGNQEFQEVNLLVLDFVSPDAELIRASRAGNIKGVTRLLHQPQNPNVKDAEMMTPLHVAALEGKLKCLRLLLEAFAELHPNRWGFTACHLAAMNGHAEALRLLMESEKAQAGVYHSHSPTPLHVACVQGQVDIVRLLLSLQSDTDDRCGALRLAAGHGHTDIVRLLMATERREISASNVLVAAADGGHVEVLQLVIEAFNLDINTEITSSGHTALHLAAEEGDLRVVQACIQLDADKNKATHAGMTPLHLAAWRGHVTVGRFLIEHSGDVNMVTTDGVTALHLATQAGHLGFVHLLLQAGADKSQYDHGLTPLQMAALWNGHLETMLALADVMQCDHLWWCWMIMIEILLQHVTKCTCEQTWVLHALQINSSIKFITRSGHVMAALQGEKLSLLERGCIHCIWICALQVLKRMQMQGRVDIIEV